MDNAPLVEGKWTERSSASNTPPSEFQAMFDLLFERSGDAIWLIDPHGQKVVDCNPAAVHLLRAADREQVLSCRPVDGLPCPPGTIPSNAGSPLASPGRAGTRTFECVGNRFDGTPVPLEMIITPITSKGRSLQVVISRDITQRKSAEQRIHELNQILERRIRERTAELAASEAQFRTLIDHAPEAITVFGGETGRFRVVNENAVRLFGLSAAQLKMLTPADVSPDRQPDGRLSSVVADEKIREAVAGGTPIFDWAHRHADGRLIPCEVRLVRLPGEGAPLIRASIIDNTERQRREKVQRATFEISEAVHTTEDLPSLYRRIHTIVQGLMSAENFYIALLDPRTGMISFDYHVDERTPKPRPQPLNTGLTSVVLRTHRPLLVGSEAEGRKQRIGREVRLDGLEKPSYVESGIPAAIWLGVPLLFQNRAFGVVAVQDYRSEQAYGEEAKQILTFVAGQMALAIQRKRAEQNLRDSEEKFRALFEASSQGVILQDEQAMLEINPAGLRILGFSAPEEVLGKHPAETSAPIQPNGESAMTLARQHIQECLANGNCRFEWLTRNAQGTDIPIEVVLTRVQLQGRQLIQAVFNDITERKRAEAELRRALQRERELGHLKSNFVSMVSHEFRTPLGIIQSSAEILQDYFERLEAGERAEQLRSIIKNTRRMAEMMDCILVLSRLDAGKIEFAPGTLKTASFFERLIQEVLSATGHRCPVELTMECLPPEVRADSRLLGHIFTNLLNNAVKYSEPGVPVSFTLKREGNYLVCDVCDRGIGIPEKDLGWLFQAFHRGSNVGDRPGTGLGLFLVKRCVELHHGHLGISSEPGRGTQVTVKLPVYDL